MGLVTEVCSSVQVVIPLGVWVCCGIAGSVLTCWVRLSTMWREPESRMRRRRSFGPNKNRRGICCVSRWWKNRYLWCYYIPVGSSSPWRGFIFSFTSDFDSVLSSSKVLLINLVGLSPSNLVRRKSGAERWRNRRSSWSKELCTWRRPRTCSPSQRDQRKWPRTRRREAAAAEDV